MEYTVIQFIEDLSDKFRPAYEDEISRHQAAWWLLEKLTSKSEACLIAQKTLHLSHAQEKLLNEWIQEHIEKHKPLQYILGSVPFLNLDIKVKPPVLIPRPETEEWTLDLINQLKKLHNQKLTILDIGTGSGCIALSLGKALPEATVYAADIFDQALELAQENAVHNDIHNVKLIFSDVFDQMPVNLFCDLIVSNPPYIGPHEWQTLSPSVTEWEDKRALIAPDEGLAVILKIIAGAKKHLKINHEMQQKNIPQLLLEIGYAQRDAVTQLMEKAGFKNVSVIKDLEGKDRVVTGNM